MCWGWGGGSRPDKHLYDSLAHSLICKSSVEIKKISNSTENSCCCNNNVEYPWHRSAVTDLYLCALCLLELLLFFNSSIALLASCDDMNDLWRFGGILMGCVLIRAAFNKWTNKPTK